ncbi:N-acetyltransferase [Candidatus Woesearchaeota archaeon]|nr:N-acetyltransferase [Candidatus Woesearchaeota archaeon]
MIHKTADVEEGASIGNNTNIWHQCHVRKGAKIGENCILGKNVFVDSGAILGNNVKIQNNVSVYEGVTLEDGVFVGPHTTFTNDVQPRAINIDGSLKKGLDWKLSKTLVKKGASIGAGSVVLCNLTIGEFAMVGAGSVVTKEVPAYGLVYGVPAKLIGYVCKCGKKLGDIYLKGKVKCGFCKSEIII